MEGENLGHSALETRPGKATRSETAEPGDRHHLRAAHRGRREGGTQGRLRDGGTAQGRRTQDENKNPGRLRNTVTSRVQKGPERAPTQPLFRQNPFCALPQTPPLGPQASETMLEGLLLITMTM